MGFDQYPSSDPEKNQYPGDARQVIALMAGRAMRQIGHAAAISKSVYYGALNRSHRATRRNLRL